MINQIYGDAYPVIFNFRVIFVFNQINDVVFVEYPMFHNIRSLYIYIEIGEGDMCV